MEAVVRFFPRRDEGDAPSGEGASIPVTILQAASTVWRDRLNLAPLAEGVDAEAVEDCSPLEIQSFVAVISLVSTDAPAQLSSSCNNLMLMQLTSSLGLIHKYDCPGAMRLASFLAALHFPRCTYTPTPGLEPEMEPKVVPVSLWLTQDHIDWCVRAQELFAAPGSEGELSTVLNSNQVCTRATTAPALRKTTRFHRPPPLLLLLFLPSRVPRAQIAILAHACSGAGLQWSRCRRGVSSLMSFRHQRVLIQTHQDNPPHAVETRSYVSPKHACAHLFASPLVVQRFRLTPATLGAILDLVVPKQALAVVQPVAPPSVLPSPISPAAPSGTTAPACGYPGFYPDLLRGTAGSAHGAASQDELSAQELAQRQAQTMAQHLAQPLSHGFREPEAWPGSDAGSDEHEEVDSEGQSELSSSEAGSIFGDA